MFKGDVFERPTHIVVGGTAKTWLKQSEWLREAWVNLVSTWSWATTYNFWAWDDVVIVDDTTWLPLNNKWVIDSSISGTHARHITTYKKKVWSNQYQNKLEVDSEEHIPWNLWIGDVAADILTFGQPVHLTCHAMAMTKISDKYPEEVTQALQATNAQVADIIYISYEAWFDPEKNPNGVHVYYPARDMKDKMEQSTLEALGKAKIVDLITFDSPSAKALGFTFLWIVWDFINFMEEKPDNKITKKFQWLMKEFLWNDYQGIINMFAQYPIRWELWEWQKSMRNMAENGEYFSMISGQTKKIDFAKFSRISGVITDLYLYLAMNDLNTNREDILNSSSDRVLMDWDRITSQDYVSIEEKVDMYFKQLSDVTDPSLTPEWPRNWLYVEVWGSENSKDHDFDIANLKFLRHHFGVLPLFMMSDMVKTSWLLGTWEYLKLAKPKSSVYAYNKVQIVREWNNVIVRNTDDPKEVFCHYTVWGRSSMQRPMRDESGYVIPDSEREKPVDLESFPHSVPYGDMFLRTIPTELEWIEFSRSSAFVEHLAFQAANFFLNNPNPQHISKIQEKFSKMKTFDRTQLQWKFSKVEVIYEDPDIEEKTKDTIPSPSIVKAGFAAGKLVMTIEAIDSKGEVIGKYLFAFD